VTAEDILSLARDELGVKESPMGSNQVKYNTAYYGRAVSGSAWAWCCTFIWWLFKAGDASDLFYGGGKTASCTTLMKYYRVQGQIVTDPRPGDLVFYNWKGAKSTAVHIGVVESIDADGDIIAIEGNTSIESDDNGGKVMRRNRKRSVCIAFARPKYSKGDEEMTQAQFDAMMDNYLAVRKEIPPSTWSAEDRKWAEENGIIGGDEKGHKMYKSFTTREEMAAMLHRLAVLLEKE